MTRTSPPDFMLTSAARYVNFNRERRGGGECANRQLVSILRHYTPSRQAGRRQRQRGPYKLRSGTAAVHQSGASGAGPPVTRPLWLAEAFPLIAEGRRERKRERERGGEGEGGRDFAQKKKSFQGKLPCQNKSKVTGVFFWVVFLLLLLT